MLHKRYITLGSIAFLDTKNNWKIGAFGLVLGINFREPQTRARQDCFGHKTDAMNTRARGCLKGCPRREALSIGRGIAEPAKRVSICRESY